ncbi:MAG: HEAT repeat domain-containing protein [Thermodesulfobacteriota bacterium]
MARTKAFATVCLILFMAPALCFAGPAKDRLGRAANADDYAAAYEEIAGLGDAALADLLDVLAARVVAIDMRAAQKDRADKVTALNLLGEIKAQKALPVLAGILVSSDSASLVMNAARAIGNIGGNQAYKILADALDKAENGQVALPDAVRKAAVLGLGLCGDKKAADLLLAVLNDEASPEALRIYAAGSLGLLGDDSGLGLAREGLNSMDPDVRLAAMRALGAIGAEAALSDLSFYAGQDAKFVERSAAGLAVVQIKCANMAQGKKAGFILNELVKTPRASELIAWGTRELKSMGTPEAKSALAELAGKKGPEFAALNRAARIKEKAMP